MCRQLTVQSPQMPWDVFCQELPRTQESAAQRQRLHLHLHLHLRKEMLRHQRQEIDSHLVFNLLTHKLKTSCFLSFRKIQQGEHPTNKQQATGIAISAQINFGCARNQIN